MKWNPTTILGGESIKVTLAISRLESKWNSKVKSRKEGVKYYTVQGADSLKTAL